MIKKSNPLQSLSTEIMKLYILKEVLFDYTPGMCLIAAENMNQCRELFVEEFGKYHAEEFNNAKVTIIESVGLDEAGIVEYVYGGG